ncbi:hypothetical protein MLC59_09530 [Marinobacter bryozoorum]|uniref:hypothetical protein n=1 Tax=Marinobacter bryozoorum TaxID=256324 RepID=UPI002002A7DC|nr:hypothetical protein [Marinobacter bryozoorum]MCK7544408.1 hypothetical protein [Marinobacter bryozoorum]
MVSHIPLSKQALIVFGSSVALVLTLGLLDHLLPNQSVNPWLLVGVLCAVGFVLTFFLSLAMALVLAVVLPLIVTIGMSLLAKPGAEQGLEGIFFVVVSMFFVPSVLSGLVVKFIARRI